MTLTIVPAIVLRLGKLVCPTTTTPGAIVPTPTNIWFPVAPTVTALPSAPAYDTEPELIPANSTAVDACFDPDNVDVQQLFNNFIPAVDTDPVYDTSANVTTLVQPKNETVPVRYRLRSVLAVLYANYSVQAQLTAATLESKVSVSAFKFRYKLVSDGSNFAHTGNNATLSFRLNGLASLGTFLLNGQPVELTPNFGPMTFDVGQFNLLPEANTLLLAQFDTNFADTSGYNVALVPLDNSSSTPPAIDNGTVKFGAGSLYVASTAGTNAGQGLQFYLNPDAAPSYSDDFTVAMWIYPEAGLSQEAIWGVDFSQENFDGSGYVIIVEEDFITPANKTIYFAGYSNFGDLDILIAPTNILNNGQWYHVVLQRSGGICTLFLDGENVGSAGAVFSLKNRHMLGNYEQDKTSTHFYQFNGYIDSVLIADTAVYPLADFSVPGAPYSTSSFDSANFNVLLPFSADSGSFTLTGQDAVTAPLEYKGISDVAAFALTGYEAIFQRPARSFVATVTPFNVTALGSVDAPSIRGSASNSSSASSITVTWPTVELNDIAFLALESDSNIKLPLLPPDWQQVTGSPLNTNSGTSGTALVLYWKRITTLPQSSFTITDLGDHILRQLTIWRGAKTTGTPFVAGNSGVFTTSATSHIVPAITTTGNSSKVLIFASTPIDSATPWGVTPTNTVLTDKNNQVTGTSTGNGGGLQVFYGTKLLPGSSGTTTVNLLSSNQMTYISIELLAEG